MVTQLVEDSPTQASSLKLSIHTGDPCDMEMILRLLGEPNECTSTRKTSVRVSPGVTGGQVDEGQSGRATAGTTCLGCQALTLMSSEDSRKTLRLRNQKASPRRPESSSIRLPSKTPPLTYCPSSGSQKTGKQKML